MAVRQGLRATAGSPQHGDVRPPAHHVQPPAHPLSTQLSFLELSTQLGIGESHRARDGRPRHRPLMSGDFPHWWSIWLLPPVGDTTTGSFRSLRSTRREWNVCRPRRLAANDLMVAMQWSHRRMCLQSHTHHHTSQAFVHCTQHGPAASRAKPHRGG